MEKTDELIKDTEQAENIDLIAEKLWEYIDSVRRENRQIMYYDLFFAMIYAAGDLVDAVEKYVRQECSRGTLLARKDKLKKLLEYETNPD